MIHVESLTKRYGDKVAVDDLSFEVRPGIVTGFLGPNGAGKSTTMRMILGLDRPTRGRAVIQGRPFTDHPDGLRHVGPCSMRERHRRADAPRRTCTPPPQRWAWARHASKR